MVSDPQPQFLNPVVSKLIKHLLKQLYCYINANNKHSYSHILELHNFINLNFLNLLYLLHINKFKLYSCIEV